MSFPQIPEELSENKWVLADPSVVVELLEDMMPFNKRELEYISSEVLTQQHVSPNIFTFENHIHKWTSKAGNFCLDQIDIGSLILFLQKSLQNGQELVIGTTMFYDQHEDEHVNRLVVCPKSLVGTHVEMKLVEKIKRFIQIMRDNYKKDELRKIERENKKEKMTQLIEKFQNKEISFEEFQTESAKLK